MPRPFRLFSHYDFFSVFIPGFATVLGIFVLIPVPITDGNIWSNLALALLPTLVLAFVFGQALHSIADFLERHHEKPLLRLNVSPYSGGFRSEFAERINYSYEEDINDDAGDLGEQIVNERFREACSVLLSNELVNYGGEEMTADDWKEIYPVVQSQIYASEAGRSRTFQSIYAFCRSMFTLSSLLSIAYLIYAVFRAGYFPSWIISLLGLETDPLQGSLIAIYLWWTLPLSAIGVITFGYAAISYKSYFVQYLISDFLTITYGRELEMEDE